MRTGSRSPADARLRTGRRRVAAVLALGLIGCSLGSGSGPTSRSSCGAWPGEGQIASGAGCPPGEVCSKDGKGLSFRGTLLGEDTLLWFPAVLHATAVKGRQKVHVASSSPPFEAKSSATGVFRADAHPPDVDVSGVGAGTAFLRIVEPGTDTLLDRVSLDVAPIARASLVSLEMAALGAPSDTTWVALAGSSIGSIAVIVALESEAGGRLVDQGLAVSDPAGATLEAREMADVDGAAAGWDVYDVVTGDPGELALHVKAGASSFSSSSTMKVVGAVDDIALGCFGQADQMVVHLEESTDICFSALAAGVQVVGATWTFASSASAAAHVPLFSGSRARVALFGKVLGAGVLTVTASGVSKTFPFEVVPKP